MPSRRIKQAPPPPPAVRPVIYARVSSQIQKDRHTIKNQLRELPGYVERQGWTLAQPAETYVDDGLSAKAGRLDERDAFRRLIRDAQSGAFDTVVVVGMDRLTRTDDLAERGMILGALQKAGIKVADATSNQILDLNSSSGDLFSGLQAYFASEENRKRVERSRSGKERAAAEGRKPHGPTPFGYRYNRGTGEWSIHPGEAAVVREIFESVIAGMSCRMIAAVLQKRGVRTSRGSLVAGSFVWHVANSSTYSGTWECFGRRIPVPPIVSEERVAAVKEQFSRHALRGLRRTRHFYLLEGLMVCEQCGGRIRLSPDRSRTGELRPAYGCVGRRRSWVLRGEGTATCTMPRHKTAVLDRVVWDKLRSMIENPRLVDDLLRQMRAAVRADKATWQTDLSDAQVRLERLEATQTAILSRFTAGLIPESVMDKQLATAARERALIERQVQSASRASRQAATTTAQIAELGELLAELRRDVPTATPERQRQVLEGLLGRGNRLVMTPTGVRGLARFPYVRATTTTAFVSGVRASRKSTRIVLDASASTGHDSPHREYLEIPLVA